MKRTTELRRMIESGKTYLIPGVYDGLSARIAEAAGAERSKSRGLIKEIAERIREGKSATSGVMRPESRPENLANFVVMEATALKFPCSFRRTSSIYSLVNTCLLGRNILPTLFMARESPCLS